MATDISLRDDELVKDGLTGYTAAGVGSARYRVSKQIIDNGSTITCKLTCTLYTNNGYVNPGTISYYLDLNVAGVTASVLWKGPSEAWAQNSTYTKTIEVTIPKTESTSRSASIAVRGVNGSAFNFDSTQQGGTTLDNLPTFEGVLYIRAADSSGAPVLGEVWVGDANGVPQKALEVWVGDANGVPQRSRA
ncbi:MAG: hypothetical protein QM296_02390 [Bacillota bacterium]|nr:hypothetical protein [Bacillota bacterium]